MKRIIALIGIVAMSLSLAAFPVSAGDENITYVVNGINSYRDADMLIVYNTSGTTGTNEWGYEVTVGMNGKTTSVGKIPDSGAKEALESDMKLMNRLAAQYTGEAPADISDGADEAASDSESGTAASDSGASEAETDTSRGKLVLAAVIAVDLIIVTAVAAFMSKKRFGKKNDSGNK